MDNRYHAFLYRDELPAGARVGMRLSGFVQRLRADGKLDVSLRKAGAKGMADARDVLLKVLAANGGVLPLHDGSTPEEIRRALGMSKKTFKKAVGGLYKDGLVTLADDRVRLTEKGVVTGPRGDAPGC